MLVKIFSLITDKSPFARKAIWKFWYNFLGGRFQQKDWSFMNYGYEPLEEDEFRPDLEGFNEQDRSCIQMYDHLAESADLKDKLVIEVGSGRGGGCTWIHSKHHPRKTRGIDFSDEAVALCRKRHDFDGLTFRQGDAEDLPIGDGKIDAVFNVESSHCYGSRKNFYHEVNRVLKEDGQFLYADFFTQEELEEAKGWLEQAGLEVVTEREITPNVVRAMDKDDEWKSERIKEELPSAIGSIFGQFAGLKDSKVYNSFDTRYLVYMSWVLRKK